MNTKPIWYNFETKTNYPKLNKNIETDVCIVGGGIAGLSIAYELLSQGKNVIVLERDSIGSGETLNTSAHLSNALDDGYSRIKKMHGPKKAKLAAQSHTNAINWIEKIITKEAIDCDFKRIPGYLFSVNDNIKELIKEHNAAKDAGIAVTYDERLNLGKSVYFPDQARFHMQKYLQGLAQSIIKKGGQIFEDSEATQIDFKKNTITLSNKSIVQVQHIVIATNAPKFSYLTMHLKINPQRSYMLGVKIPKGSIPDALFWDTAKPYHYVRIQNFDDSSDILLVGGEDHRVGVKPKHDPYAKLYEWTKQHFNIKNAPIIYQWSGQILEPIDYLAYMGEHPKHKNAYMVSGDSGHGLTHGTIAAMLISGLICRNQHEYTELYEVARFPLRACKNFINNVVASSLGYIKYLLPQRGKLPKQGEGKIIQQGFKKIAVYKDEHDKLHKCSGICSHMGAVLSWNPTEKTWDCPAHGSRFDLNGKSLNGPANKMIQCPFRS